jgi:hypothetical protein
MDTLVLSCELNPHDNLNVRFGFMSMRSVGIQVRSAQGDVCILLSPASIRCLHDHIGAFLNCFAIGRDIADAPPFEIADDRSRSTDRLAKPTRPPGETLPRAVIQGKRDTSMIAGMSGTSDLQRTRSARALRFASCGRARISKMPILTALLQHLRGILSRRQRRPREPTSS